MSAPTLVAISREFVVVGVVAVNVPGVPRKSIDSSPVAISEA